MGTGGYVCGPVVLAASLKGIPTIIHEQNAIPGLTNKILSYFVSKIAITFSESERFFPKSKVVLTGNPIRENILRKIGESNKEKWGINKDKPTVLAVGGSRGASRLNDFVINIIPKLIEEKIQLIFITGEREYERVIRTLKEKGINNLEGIIIIPYAYNMDDALTACDLIISRAGATIISEITALGIPSILIPSPNVANNHQEYNALSLEQNGAAIVIKESQISDDVFSQQVISLAKNKDLLTKMSSNAKKFAKIDAADKICEIISELVKKDD
ncbi:UDP-N-acetylglucosamine--N-acetylmuramyl-(pentapeptide) pyrophosphoryl-undecaprenol N-acetylglucosamine transferase [Caloramator sp. Dgby_cultured_2]|nr:UDP-N-acetylglucosamine--N-acetylmuramyl-(pentapeptide) pyrophosphoryl-undecaprenol N-acetylglucosamine transferase [Caloramator sp. Dgby_cultured_2]WDU84481.1 UDP-N-acetylglucosamine--N-acetylmuramyl-(pentapeptide) pyrophosphoryl-undecaprenol N-acetylglucosamine transferase [Caloramator sp. Dgby_cultured_2]